MKLFGSQITTITIDTAASSTTQHMSKWNPLAAISLSVVISCKRSYLDVAEPTAIWPNLFPSKVEDFDLMLIDVYGRLRSSYFNSDIFDKAGIGLDHASDQGYNGAGFNEWFQNNLLPTNVQVANLWNNLYASISRANAFFDALTKFHSKGITPDQETQLKLLEGQGYFLRALNYYYLMQFFREVPLTRMPTKPASAFLYGLQLPLQLMKSIRKEPQ